MLSNKTSIVNKSLFIGIMYEYIIQFENMYVYIFTVSSLTRQFLFELLVNHCVPVLILLQFLY